MRNFVKDESGVVTIDWVILAAAIVALGFSVMMAITPGTVGLSDKISGAMETGEAGQ